MRAKLANAYARAGGDDEKAARILGVTLGSARLAKTAPGRARNGRDNNVPVEESRKSQLRDRGRRISGNSSNMGPCVSGLHGALSGSLPVRTARTWLAPPTSLRQSGVVTRLLGNL